MKASRDKGARRDPRELLGRLLSQPGHKDRAGEQHEDLRVFKATDRTRRILR